MHSRRDHPLFSSEVTPERLDFATRNATFPGMVQGRVPGALGKQRRKSLYRSRLPPGVARQSGTLGPNGLNHARKGSGQRTARPSGISNCQFGKPTTPTTALRLCTRSAVRCEPVSRSTGMRGVAAYAPLDKLVVQPGEHEACRAGRLSLWLRCQTLQMLHPMRRLVPIHDRKIMRSHNPEGNFIGVW